MKGPIDRGKVKAAWRRAAGERGEAGKALSRIDYFEAQRGLRKTRWDQGIAQPDAASLRRPLKTPRKQQLTPLANAPYLVAHTQKRALQLEFSDSANLPVWRPLGPEHIPEGQTYGSGGNNKPPVSGRCVGLVVAPNDPRRLIVCTAGGGLWMSQNRGKTWRPLTDQQPTLSMGAIARAPSSPNLMYAGTGEGDTMSQQGVGLLRSSNGGLTWEHVEAPLLGGIGICDIAVHPDDPFHLWVATTKSLVESKDGGDSWREVQPVTTWSVSIHPNSTEIFAATASGLIHSGNGGKNWNLVPLPNAPNNGKYRRIEVQHAPSAPRVVYVAAAFQGPVQGSWGGLWRRASEGGAFSSQTPPPLKSDSDIAQAWYDWCIGVSPEDPDVLFWGAVQLFKGTRTGSSWTWRNISSRSSGDSIHPDQHHIAFDPSDPKVVYVCNDGGVFRSLNNGANWESLNRGLEITEFEFLIHFEKEDEWLIGGTQDNGTLTDREHGQWDQIALGDGGDCAVDEDQDHCYHSYYGMTIERAQAFGSQAFEWTNVSPPVSWNYRAFFYPPMDMAHGVLAKAGVTVFVSEDSGDSWEEVAFDGQAGERATAVTIHDEQTILVGGERGSLARIERGATGWNDATVVKLTPAREDFVSDIFAESDATDTLWLSSSAFNGSHVFQSTDSGQSWQDKTANLPNIPVNALVVDPEDPLHVYAATDHGVYRTTDGGTRWADFSNGLPNVVVGDMILHERRRVLRIGTRSRGAWEVEI